MSNNLPNFKLLCYNERSKIHKINEYYEVDEGGKVRGEKKEDLKFTPRPPPPKEYLPTPIGRNHTRGPKISPLAQKCFNFILYLAFIYSSLYNMLIVI